MWGKALVLAAYLGAILGLGVVARRRSRRTLEDYFIASRTIPPLVLFLTMAATNFSAFTVFGFSGAGWRIGYAFYPVMAFGTGFMALSFHFIGKPAWRLGRERGLITPPELVFDRFKSTPLRLLFFGVMAAFTLPYIAMQPMAAGYALEELLGIPYPAGAALITGVMLAYTSLGGMRGVAWTDVLQGSMMFVLLAVALAFAVAPHGGIAAANREALARWPQLFSRPGMGNAFPPGIWLGYMLLWFLCDPMFPQLFQRFYAAKDERALSTTMVLYPVVTGLLFLLPVTIGVVGRITFPELPAGAASDRILPLLLSRHAPPVVEALVSAAALAALMSTLDSQLLTLSSMFARDLYEPLRRRKASPSVGKLFVALLAIGGLLMALRPPATFLEIATEAFTGLAVLFPTVVAALHWPRATASGAIASISVGEGLVIAHHFGWLPGPGTLPVVPAVAASALVLIAVSLLTGRGRPGPGRRGRRSWPWALLFAGIFVLGNDFWAWGDARTAALGFPWWVWYHLGLCLLTALAFLAFAVREGRGGR